MEYESCRFDQRHRTRIEFFFYSDLCLTIVCVFPSFLFFSFFFFFFFFFTTICFFSFLAIVVFFRIRRTVCRSSTPLGRLILSQNTVFFFLLNCVIFYVQRFILSFYSFLFFSRSFAFFCTLYILCEVAFVLVCMTKYCVLLL